MYRCKYIYINMYVYTPPRRPPAGERAWARPPRHPTPWKGFNFQKWRNEDYPTSWSLQVILKRSCSKLHCIKVFKLKLFIVKVGDDGTGSPDTTEKTASRRDNIFPSPTPPHALKFTGKEYQFKTFCNDAYCTNALLLLIKIMLCRKLHCRIFLKLKLFSYQIGGWAS